MEHHSLPDTGQAAPEERDRLLDYLQRLSRHKLALLTAAAFGVLVAIGFCMTQPPLYETTTTIELQGVNENFLDMRRVDPNSADYGADTYVQTQIKLLQSTSLRDRVVERLRNANNAPTTVFKDGVAQTPATLPALRAAVGLGTINIVPKKEALTLAETTLKVRGAGLTRIVEVSAQSTVPELVAEFTNTLADEFIQHNLQSRLHTAQETTKWLSSQLDDLKVKLEQSERRLQAAAQGSSLTVTTQQENLAEAKLKQIQTDLVNAQADLAIKQSVHELAKERSPEELPDILGDPMLRDHKAKVTDLQRQIADRSSVFTSDHPDVVRLNQQLRTLQSARDREVQNILRRIATEFQTTTRRHSLLEASYIKQLSAVTDQADKAIQYNLAKRELDTNRALYDTMLQKVREAGMAAAMRRSEARVIDYARPPTKPTSPNIAVMFALGMFGGTTLGLGFVSLKQHLSSQFENPGDTFSYLGVPELGVIPNSQSDRQAGRRGPLSLLPEPEFLGAHSTELSAWAGGPCLTTESFHGTLVSINFSANGDLNRRVLMVTSADPSEGKTFSSVNLAVAASKRGLRVLLIDADMRKGRTHTIFGTGSAPGLSDLLATNAAPDPTSMAASVHDTRVPNLSLMPGGETDAHTDIACLLHSPKLAAVIDWARDRYDLVFIDTPPVLQVSDARVVSRHVDAIVFAVRAGKTQHARAREALQKFEQDGALVIGTLLTDWRPRSARLSYYKRDNS